ncbi:UNVERIFIED_CONTAM: RNA polymerase sigma-70 factor (TIGR02957 family) [Brevibacillus sp. OAP136]
METTEQFYNEFKPLLFSLAYRMLGSAMDAEDIVHEVFLTLRNIETEPISNMRAYLCKIVTNRCIDRLRSSSKKREVYVGPWLPEPIVTDGRDAGDPMQSYLAKESITTAYLLLLQQLSWVERAVFLLREVLQYDYDEIAEIVGKTSTNCRQIFHRAKRSIGGKHAMLVQGEGAEQSDGKRLAGEASRVIDQFVEALQSGNIGKLMSVLAADSTLFSDGGGKVTAAVRPIVGAERIALFLAGIMAKATSGFSFKVAVVNNQPGIVTYEDGKPSSVVSFLVEEGSIAAIYIVVNPDKLLHVH